MKVWKIWRFGDRRFGTPDITKPSIKTLNHPLSSTFLPFNCLIKISVSINLLNKPHQMVFKSLPSLKSAGIKPSPWIYIVHILIIKPDTCTQVQTFISGYLDYLAMGISGYKVWKVCYYIWDNGIFFTFPLKFDTLDTCIPTSLSAINAKPQFIWKSIKN